MTSIHTEVKPILHHIEKLAYDAYIKKTIGKPPIPVFFVQVLHLMMKSYGISKEQSHVYSVATALLQMGLDTHDYVSVSTDLTAEKKRKRQLYVLAGDYYSSLFYHLLSSHGEVEGIHCLSQAACVINEWKMDVHVQNSEASSIHYLGLKHKQHISSKLLTALADFFHVEKKLKNSWIKIIPDLILFNCLCVHQEIIEQIGTAELEMVQITWKELRQEIDQFSQPEIRQALLHLMYDQIASVSKLSLVKES